MRGSGSDRARQDLELTRRCLAGDDEAWRRLVQTHRQHMITLAARIVAPATAADVVDGVLADIWERKKLGRFEGRSTLATWLGAIAINAALNAKRDAGERTVPIDDAPDIPAPPAPVEQSALAEILFDAVSALSLDAKVLVLMYYEQGVTLDEAAVVLGASKSTLSRTLTKAREFIAVEADRLSRERLRVTLSTLRSGADLGQLDLDLRRACAAARDRTKRSVSRS